MSETEGRLNELAKWQPKHEYLKLGPFLSSQTDWASVDALAVVRGLDLIGKDGNLRVL